MTSRIGRNGSCGLDEVGGASHVLISSYRPDGSLVGKTLEQIAQARGIDATQLIVDMIHAAGRDIGVIVTAMVEDDLRAILAHPRTIICSDGMMTGRHPRDYGAFPRVLGHYVREEHVIVARGGARQDDQPFRAPDRTTRSR